MTTDSSASPTPSGRGTSGPSVHVLRARKLLYGGLAGGIAAGLLCVIVFSVLDGVRGLGSAGFGAAMVLFFYAVGQLVMVKFADAGARTLLAVSMTSYTARVVVLGIILLIFSKNRDAWSAIDANAIFIATIAVVVGWLVIEIYVFRRLRISIYDSGYEDRPDDRTAADVAVVGEHADEAHRAVTGDRSAAEPSTRRGADS